MVASEFEELDHRVTALGALSLRRRRDPAVSGRVVYEIKLDNDFLMSSLFTAGERALADLALKALPGDGLDVLVAGLGLGYTAVAALEHERVASVLVVEALNEVIEWHRRGLVPLGQRLTEDKRCELRQGDFFALAEDPASGFDRDRPGRRFDAILLDIDHSPSHWLRATNAVFYTPSALRRLKVHLRPSGVFALWSNDAPDREFETKLISAFATASAHVVEFANPYTGGRSASTVYLAATGS